MAQEHYGYMVTVKRVGSELYLERRIAFNENDAKCIVDDFVDRYDYGAFFHNRKTMSNEDTYTVILSNNSGEPEELWISMKKTHLVLLDK